MPYVKRDATGRIIAMSLVKPETWALHDWVELDRDYKELNAFEESVGGSDDDALISNLRWMSEVEASDRAFIRVLEDLIDVLVDRGVIRFTDLPEAAQAKISQRQSMRRKIHDLNLLDDDSGVI
jgi:hypothetical protein